MEQHSSLISPQVNPADCILNSQTSGLVLNNDGLQLLQETIGAVKVAIDKINFFKNYLNQQRELNTFAKCSSLSREINEKDVTDKINLNKLSIIPVQNLIDHNLQVFFTVLDNKVTELDVREAVEKEGFEDFVITIKNRQSHTFGFIKFSNEESVNRALDYNLKISVNGQLIKIRPHKNCKGITSGSLIADTNCISKEIDEGILINVSSGYQNRRILNNYLESVSNQLEQNEENLTNIEPKNSFYQTPNAQVPDINKSQSIDSFKENIIKKISPQSESFSHKIQCETDMEWNENEYHTSSINRNVNQSSEKSIQAKKKTKNKEKNNVSKVNSQTGRKKFKYYKKKKNNKVVNLDHYQENCITFNKFKNNS